MTKAKSVPVSNTAHFGWLANVYGEKVILLDPGSANCYKHALGYGPEHQLVVAMFLGSGTVFVEDPVCFTLLGKVLPT